MYVCLVESVGVGEKKRLCLGGVVLVDKVNRRERNVANCGEWGVRKGLRVVRRSLGRVAVAVN